MKSGGSEFLCMQKLKICTWVSLCMPHTYLECSRMHCKWKIKKSNKFYRNISWIFSSLFSLNSLVPMGTPRAWDWQAMKIVKIQYLLFGRFDYLGHGGYLAMYDIVGLCRTVIRYWVPSEMERFSNFTH